MRSIDSEAQTDVCGGGWESRLGVTTAAGDSPPVVLRHELLQQQEAHEAGAEDVEEAHDHRCSRKGGMEESVRGCALTDRGDTSREQQEAGRAPADPPTHTSTHLSWSS